MTQNPFSKRPPPSDPGVNNRRSTRVDFACPVVVSGRDVVGQPFREETETSTVNLHGCKLRLDHQVLVGMVVSLESPYVESAAKAICVHVWEPGADQTAREVAVQLLKPQNLWGLKDPPADWAAVMGTIGPGPAARPGRSATVVVVPRLGNSAAPAPSKAQSVPPTVPSRAAAPAPAPPKSPPPPANALRPVASPAPVSRQAQPAQTADAKLAAPRVAREPAPSPAPPAPSAPIPDSQSNSRLAELEDQSWQLMDSVLQALRDQTEELVRGTLQEFRQHLEALARGTEERLQQRAEQCYADVEYASSTLRGDLADQLTHRTEEIVESAKEALHARVEEMFSTMLNSSQGKSEKSSSRK